MFIDELHTSVINVKNIQSQTQKTVRLLSDFSLGMADLFFCVCVCVCVCVSFQSASYIDL